MGQKNGGQKCNLLNHYINHQNEKRISSYPAIHPPLYILFLRK